MSESESTTNKPALKQVNLDRETIETIDAIGLNLSAAVEAAASVSIELTRPQIVKSIAMTVLAQQDAAADAALLRYREAAAAGAAAEMAEEHGDPDTDS
jgi:precorrin-4 methylase